MRIRLTGPVHGDPGGSMVTIGAGGFVYVGSRLAVQVPKDRRWVVLEYDAEAGELYLVILAAAENGALKIQRKKAHDSGLRVNARRLLGQAGLLPRDGLKRISMGGTWDPQRQEIRVQIRESPGRVPKKDARKSEELDEAVEFEDRPPAASSSPGKGDEAADEALTALPLKPSALRATAALTPPADVARGRLPRLGKPVNIEEAAPARKPRCVNCRWYGASSTICRSTRGPHADRHVEGTGLCGSYKAWQGPGGGRRNEELAEPSEDKGPSRVTGTRPRGLCPICHHEFPVTHKGLFSHDVDGVMYLAGRGNRKRRCPGCNQGAQS
jgi:hypothetical protein